METAVRAPAAGQVTEVLVRTGQAVEARDLLLIVS